MKSNKIINKIRIFSSNILYLFLILHLLISFVAAEENMQFITFKSGEWVLAEKQNHNGEEQYPKEKAICELSTKEYECYKIEKDTYATELKELEKELITAKDLGF